MSDQLYNSAEESTSLPTITPPAALLLRRTQAALGLLREVVQESSAEYWYEEGEKAIIAKDYAKAVLYYTNSIEINPNEARTYNSRGFTKYCQRHYHEAIYDFDHATRLDSNFVAPFFWRGEIKSKLEDNIGALFDFNRVIELNPVDSKLFHHSAYFGRSRVKERLGDIEGASIDDKKGREICGLPPTT